MTRNHSWLMSAMLLAADFAGAATEQLAVLPESGAGMALAGGRLAAVIDPTALRHSPAMILDLERPETQINFGAWKPNVGYQSPAQESVYLVDDWKFLGSIYHVQPLREGQAAFGIGFSTPFGLSYEYPRDSVFRYALPYEAMLLTADLTPVYAFRISDRLSLGVGLDIIYSDLELKQDYPWALITGVAATPDGELEFSGDGWGFGSFLGVSVELPDEQRLVVTARLPIEIEYTGVFQTSGFPEPLQALGLSSASSFRSEIKYPAKLSVGYAKTFSDRLTISGDLEWAENSVHEDIPLDIGNNQLLLGTDRLVLGWKDSMSVGIGAERRTRGNISIRTSYFYTETSMPNFTFTPAVASNDRHILSIGADYSFGQHVLDFSYSYVRMEDRNVLANQQPRYVGNYTFDWQIFTFSYRYRH